MSETYNPYAPPKASLEPNDIDGVWRDGKVLVMRQGSSLPCRCVKCNAQTLSPSKSKKVYWHHPAIYILVPFWVIIYLIVALIARKQASINPSLCPIHKKRRLVSLLAGWGGSILGLIFAIFGGMRDNCGLMSVAFVLFLASLIVGFIISRVLYPQRIDNTYVYLKGCGETFLDSLPQFHA